MSESIKNAQITAASGLIGVMIGAAISGFFSYQVAQVQLKQSVMATSAASALSIRSTLAEKASPFFLANQTFLRELDADPLSVEKVKSAAVEMDRSSSTLSPYLDADLLIACNDMVDSVHVMLMASSREAAAPAVESYKKAYQRFQILYLRLRRELERTAQVDVVDSQISPDQKKTAN